MTTTWLTPPFVIAALGGPEAFDLDPCAAPIWRPGNARPWATARAMNAEADGDGLTLDWSGSRVWCNPPYTSSDIGGWLDRLADHGSGAALIFARTETEVFSRSVWSRAAGLLFLRGRLNFHYPDALQHPDLCLASGGHVWKVKNAKTKGQGCALCGMAKANSGAPSVLVAYGQRELERLDAAREMLPGGMVYLRFARSVLVAALDSSWREITLAWIGRQAGPVGLADAYRFFARHPKAARNPNWRAKVRQSLQRHARHVARGVWAAPSEARA